MKNVISCMRDTWHSGNNGKADQQSGTPPAMMIKAESDKARKSVEAWTNLLDIVFT